MMLTSLVFSCRDSALTDCQARNTQLMQELVSYRAQSHEMSGTIAAYTELHQAQASRYIIYPAAFALLLGTAMSLLHIAGRTACIYRSAV